jgi:hypothetical protein
LTLADSPTYSPCESEETSPHFPNSSFSSFLSLDNQSPEALLPHSRIIKRLPHLFKTLPYSSQVSTAKSSMAAAEGGGARGGVVGGAGGGGAGGQVPLPQIFEKVAAIYSPLVLPITLNDLPENYIKKYAKIHRRR